ncbi:alpha/beta fold hydrolase, partial [Streptomyces albidoflavus]|uniref:alpha/beta fold hydrolase n=1 Tax=Streptomyces albidoflavus TaxID=1886 RepID=UPI0038CFE9B6
MSIGEFKSEKAAERYRAVYAYVLDQVWPGPRTAVDVSTSFGTTRVLRVGPASAEPIVLLPGAGGNSLMWHGYVEALAAHRTVIAVDTIGEAGASTQTAPVADGRDGAAPASVAEELHHAAERFTGAGGEVEPAPDGFSG